MSNSKLDRRSFIKSAGIVTAGGAAATALATPAISQDMRELKMVTTWPKNFPGLGTGAQRVADRITAASGGKITVKLFAAGELVPPFESQDAVTNGTADMYHGAEYYWQGKHKAFNFFTAVPMGLTANELEAWINFGGGQELWDELAAGFNIKPLMAGNTGVQMGGWFRKEINSLEDLQGIKMRIAGLGGEVMRKLGVNVVLMPPGEIFAAMKSGTVDAAEWVGPWNDIAFGLYKAANYYYMPAFHEIGPALEAMVNKEAYDVLPDDLKEIVKRAVMASANESYADFTYGNVKSFEPLLAKEGVELRRFPDDVMKALYKASEETLIEISQTSSLAKEIFDSFVAYRKEANNYAKASELAALEMRAKAME